MGEDLFEGFARLAVLYCNRDCLRNYYYYHYYYCCKDEF